MSSFGVVLDACVLVPACLRDTLLRTAAANFYRLHWSEDILAEVERSLVKNGLTDVTKARAVIDVMRHAFPEAAVTGYMSLISSMKNAKEDRHVLAAAVRSGSQTIVTHNLRDFPEAALRLHGVEAQSPDEFLEYQFDLDRDRMARIITAQATDTFRPALSVSEVLTFLGRDAPRTAELIANHLDEMWLGDESEIYR